MPRRDAPQITAKQHYAACSSERAAQPDALCVIGVHTTMKEGQPIVVTRDVTDRGDERPN